MKTKPIPIDPDVFLLAAERVDDGSESYCCCAIDGAHGHLIGLPAEMDSPPRQHFAGIFKEDAVNSGRDRYVFFMSMPGEYPEPWHRDAVAAETRHRVFALLICREMLLADAEQAKRNRKRRLARKAKAAIEKHGRAYRAANFPALTS